MNPDELPREALRSLAASQWAYWCSLVIAAMSAIYIPPGSMRTMVILLPIVTALFCVTVMYWLYKECDEYLQLRLLKSVCLAAAVVSFATLCYFFLELAGYPKLSMVWVNLLGWSVLNLRVLSVLFRSK